MGTYVAIWTVLVIAVLIIEAVRRFAARDEDDMLHVRDSEVQIVAKQRTMAHSLEVIDRWRGWLFAVTIVFGIALGAVWLYNAWQAGTKATF